VGLEIAGQTRSGLAMTATELANEREEGDRGVHEHARGRAPHVP